MSGDAAVPAALSGSAVDSGSTVAVGQQLPDLTVHLDRSHLVRYAGASGDFNPIHWNPRVATEVGLPDVIAHGMLTMALAGRLVTDWVGDPALVLDFGVRFTRPVVVPDPAGVDVILAGRVAEVDAQAGTVRVDITATVGGQTVLARARAVLRLPLGAPAGDAPGAAVGELSDVPAGGAPGAAAGADPRD